MLMFEGPEWVGWPGRRKCASVVKKMEPPVFGKPSARGLMCESLWPSSFAPLSLSLLYFRSGLIYCFLNLSSVSRLERESPAR